MRLITLENVTVPSIEIGGDLVFNHTVPSIEISVDVVFNQFDDEDLIAELNRRNYDNFASHALDSEIEHEFEYRDLDTSKFGLTVAHATTEQLILEIEGRGVDLMGEDVVADARNLVDKINQKRATIDEIYTMLETITGKLVCR